SSILNTGSLTLGSGSSYIADINGAAAGSGYDQIIASGTVNLTASPTLNVPLNVQSGSGFAPTLGEQFDILQNTSGTAISGTFNGLAEGATFTSGGVQFQITYLGGITGHDVILTVTALPANATYSVYENGSLTIPGTNIVTNGDFEANNVASAPVGYA